MAITKTTTTSIKDASVEEANINNCAATNTKLGADAVTSAKINNGTVTTDDLASTLDLSSKTVTLPSDAVSFDREYNNIGLLGFKMAVNESLTIFNLVDGIVDEFNDESGVDEAENTNDNYCGTDDFYQQGNNPSATTTTLTATPYDEQTFTAAADGDVTFKMWGGGGGAGLSNNTLGGPTCGPQFNGGGGGFSTGTITVEEGESFKVIVAGGGDRYSAPSPQGGVSPNPGWNGLYSSAGGGLTGLFPEATNFASGPCAAHTNAILVASGGGGGGTRSNTGSALGGAGGGTTGQSGGGPVTATGGSQSAGGSGATGTVPSPYFTPANATGGKLFGGSFAPTPFNAGRTDLSSLPGGSLQPSYPLCAPSSGQDGPGGFGGGGPGVLSFNTGPGQGIDTSGGGSGYYGGGSGEGNNSPQTGRGAGGGGSSYIGGNPTYAVAGGSTQAGCGATGGGSPDPQFSPTYGEGGTGFTYSTREGVACGVSYSQILGGTGVLIANASYVNSSINLTSGTFSSTTVPTSARIVVFAELDGNETLNTDFIAKVSRDGTNFTNATLTNSGYVTGSSGQKIFTGQVDISGQPSGQSMRYQITGANLTTAVKIHGVSLSWA